MFIGPPIVLLRLVVVLSIFSAGWLSHIKLLKKKNNIKQRNSLLTSKYLLCKHNNNKSPKKRMQVFVLFARVY